MRTLPLVTLLLVILFLVAPAACGSEAPEGSPISEPVVAPTVEAPTPEAVAEDDFPDDPQLEEGDMVPTPTAAELESMGRPELEAACFAGSTAACDRLGH